MAVVTATIKSEGRAIDPVFEVLAIDILRAVNRIPRAQLTFIDGDAAKGTFPISSAAAFVPGHSVEVLLRYEGQPEDSVFKGHVTRHSIEGGAAGATLVVDLKDKAQKMTTGRKTKVHGPRKTDTKILSDMINAAGLTTKTVDASQATHDEILQYNATDWDFLITRADVSARLVVVDDGTIALRKMEPTGQPKHKIEYGISDVFGFDMALDAADQTAATTVTAWDAKTLKPTAPERAKDVKSAMGNLDMATIAGKLGVKETTLNNPIPMTEAEIKSWGDARQTRQRLAMMRGRISVAGDAKYKLLDGVELARFGDRFRGECVITSLRHRVTPDGWQTDLEFGLTPERHARAPDISEVPAAGLLPAVNGLQIGIAGAFKEDESGEFRVQVMLPAIDPNDPSGGLVWARLASPDAGKDRGFFFRPEPGDEVVVGFFNDDPRQAVVLGAMFGSVNTLPKGVSPPSEENQERVMVSRAGSSIGFLDEEKPTVFIETPAGNKVAFSDDMEMTQISDQHGNTITMSKDGIEMKSIKDVKISASGNVEISGSKVNMK